MNNANKTPAESPACCCGGPGKWIWLLLAAAIVAVLVARNLKQSKVPPVTEASPATATIVAQGAAPAPATNAVRGQSLPRLLDLGATKCIPCKLMAPILEDLKKTYVGKMEVQFIDVWENPDAEEKYGFKLIPTQIFYDATGKELFRHEGFYGKEDILAKWKELGFDLGTTESSAPDPGAQTRP